MTSRRWWKLGGRGMWLGWRWRKERGWAEWRREGGMFNFIRGLHRTHSHTSWTLFMDRYSNIQFQPSCPFVSLVAYVSHDPPSHSPLSRALLCEDDIDLVALGLPRMQHTKFGAPPMLRPLQEGIHRHSVRLMFCQFKRMNRGLLIRSLTTVWQRLVSDTLLVKLSWTSSATCQVLERLRFISVSQSFHSGPKICADGRVTRTNPWFAI